jgi:hypothetical protein
VLLVWPNLGVFGGKANPRSATIWWHLSHSRSAVKAQAVMADDTVPSCVFPLQSYLIGTFDGGSVTPFSASALCRPYGRAAGKVREVW